MTNLVIDATAVRLVKGDDTALHTGPVGETGTAGEYYRLNTTSGKLENGNGTSTTELGNIAGILLDSVATANLTGTIALLGSKAILDLGEALASLSYGAAVYIGDTDATLADAAGTVSRVVGYVIPAWNSTTADKLLYLA